MLIDYPWYYVLLCLLAGAAYAAVLYYVGRRRFSARVNLLLAVLRFVAVAAIALLLLAPVARRTVHERQKPLVVLVDDCSQSVKLSADSAFTLHPLAEELEDYCRVELLPTPHFPLPTLTFTDLSALLDVPPDAAAVVLASDGIHNRGPNPTTTAERMGIPIYTVALGDTTPRRDAALAHLRVNRIAYLGNTFPVEVTINASLLNGHSTELRVENGARSVERIAVRYTDDEYSTTLSFDLEAKEAGLQRYTLQLGVVEDEVETRNNTLTFYVDVIDSRRKVAIVGNAPHPDLAALKQAVESNPNYEATVVLADNAVQAEARRDEAPGMVILHNLPSATHQVPSAYADLPQLYVIGNQTDLGRFNALHSGLEIVSKVKKSNEVTALYNEAFALFGLGGDDAAVIEQMPPLEAPFGEARVSASVQTLFTARLGNIDTRQPLVAATTQGSRRRAFVWGEGLWRWRLNNYLQNQSHEQFDRMVSQLVNFVAVDEGRDQLMVEAERRYTVGQPITLGAQLYNDAYEPVNDPEVTLTLDTLRYTFSKVADRYTLSLDQLPEGLYRYTATTTLNGKTLTAQGSFAVEESTLEQSNLRADHALLRTLSNLTGGKMFYPHDLSALRETLSTLKPTIYTHTRYSELLNLPWLLALIVLLLGAEWVMRKYHGEV